MGRRADGLTQGGVPSVVGNKVPHPAVLLIGLCVGLILLSRVLAWPGWSATYEIVKAPVEIAQEIDIGGSILPGELIPGEQADSGSYELVTETTEIESLLSTEGIRFLFTSFAQNFMAFTAMGIHPHRDDRACCWPR